MEAQLARIVCERFPAIEKVRFVNSGTEANMIALGAALVYTGKKKILVFQNGYHGSTISGRPANGKPSLNLPHDFIMAPYNDVPATRAIIDALPKDSLAAILVEPMLGSGGCFAGSSDFLQLLRAEATRHNALLIFDEVMTSRLSYRGYGSKIGIRPDLMTVGKWVGGGMSFGAFGGREDIMNIFDPRLGKLEHAGTFNNNVMSMSAGIAGCTILDEDLINELNSRGERMRMAIEAQLAAFDIKGVVPEAPVPDDSYPTSNLTQNGDGRALGQQQQNGYDNAEKSSLASSTACFTKPPNMFIKGVGSIMTIHFAGPDKAMLQGLFYHYMLRKGIYLAQRGFIALNIEIQDHHIEKFIDALDEFCGAWAEILR
jgi:glutamate-1-semialdehyde 2,1-aminomutase